MDGISCPSWTLYSSSQGETGAGQDFKNLSLSLDDEHSGHSGKAGSDSPVRAWRTLAHSSVLAMKMRWRHRQGFYRKQFKCGMWYGPGRVVSPLAPFM